MKDAAFSSARLLALYERISDAEDAIPRLRRFVLDLAVRGKLVEQDASDEPAAELLKRIAQEKARLVREGGFKTLDFDANELPIVEPFELPKTWAWCFLDDIAGIARGGSPRPIKAFLTDAEDGIPWIKIGDSTRGSIYINSTDERIKPEGVSRSRLVVPGDLLLSNSMSFGYPYITNISGCIHDGWLVIRTPAEEISKLYIHTMFLSNYAKEAFSEAAAGAVVQNLNADKVRRLLLPLPPLAEQHRIVAKVDELMALCDQLEQARAGREAVRDRLTTASLARLTAPETDAESFQSHARFALQSLPTLTTRPDQIKTLRQTILNLAVRGKLVAQDPIDEPAAKLLKRIEAEKARLLNEGKIREAKAVEPTKPVLGYSALPENWQHVTVANVAYLRSGVALMHDEEQDSGEIPYLKVADLSLVENDNGITTSSRFVSDERRGDIIVVGSIVFPKRGGAIATNRKRVSKVDMVGDSNLMAMKPFLNETLPFIEMWFNSFDLWVLNSGTSVPQINNKDIYPLELPLPPLAEQHRIVAKVEALMALCDHLEASLTTTATTRSKLLDALLHEALEPAADELEAAE